MKIKMKKISYRYDIYRPRSRHGHEYSKNKKFRHGHEYSKNKKFLGMIWFYMYEETPKQYLKFNS